MRHVIIIALVALSISPAAALAAPGDLDRSFGGDGAVTGSSAAAAGTA